MVLAIMALAKKLGKDVSKLTSQKSNLLFHYKSVY